MSKIKSWERAKLAVSEYKHTMPEKYEIIDPLIKPLCEILNKNNFITMHSCSGHVKAEMQNFHYYFKENEIVIRKSTFDKVPLIRNRWYILFVPKLSTNSIKKTITSINKKYKYDILLKKVNDCEGINNRWVIEENIEQNFNDQDLYERHKTIYLEFKKHFEMDGIENGIQRIKV